ncbi:MAG: response regulator, partial [Lachnospiraceae bacterium]|nr:response regulator [Lachnospiraceae bacterium]
MKVLIVEDEIRIREGIRKLLLRTDEHFEEICEACNGAEGLKLCKSMSPDLIITDIQMPE